MEVQQLMCTFLPLPLTDLENYCLVGWECDLQGMRKRNLTVVPQPLQPHKTGLSSAGERIWPLSFPCQNSCTSLPLPVPIPAPYTWCLNPRLCVCASRRLHPPIPFTWMDFLLQRKRGWKCQPIGEKPYQRSRFFFLWRTQLNIFPQCHWKQWWNKRTKLGSGAGGKF